MTTKLIWEGLGFPVILIGFKTKKINDEVLPDVNMKELQKIAFRALIYQESRLTGAQLKFIRSYLQLTQIELAKAINAADRSSLSQWENKRDEATGMDINTEIMVRLFMAKQCSDAEVQKQAHDFTWYQMKDIIFDFISKTSKSSSLVKISAA